MKTSDRAWQLWPLLTLAATNRQLLTYEIVGGLTQMHPAGLGQVLEHIQAYCLREALPPLTALVAGKKTGLPSEGFIAAEDVPRAIAEVFNHDWYEVPVPSPEELATNS